MRDFNEYSNSISDVMLRSGKLIFEKQLEGVEGHDIIIQNPNVLKIQTKGCIYNNLNPDSTSREDRGLSVRLEDDISKGSYVSILDEDYPYLVLSDIDNHYAYKSCTLRRCNQTLIINKDISFPCITSNQAYGAKTNASSDFITFPDVKLSIEVQDNVETRKILLDYRFIFEHSKTDIFKVVDRTINIAKGLITLVCEKDSYSLYDDLENNIAYQYKDNLKDDNIDVQYEIIGEETIRYNKTEEYIINISEDNGIFKILDYSNEGDCEIVRRDNQSIKLKSNTLSGFVTIGYVVEDEIKCQYDVMLVR